MERPLEIVAELSPSASWRVAARALLLPSRTMPRAPWAPALGLAYIAAVGLLGGLRGDHVLVGLLGFLDLYNEKSRISAAACDAVTQGERNRRAPRS